MERLYFYLLKSNNDNRELYSHEIGINTVHCGEDRGRERRKGVKLEIKWKC